MVAEVVKTFDSSVILNQVMRVEILDEFRYISANRSRSRHDFSLSAREGLHSYSSKLS
jgi:hypothetical protein